MTNDDTPRPDFEGWYERWMAERRQRPEARQPGESVEDWMNRWLIEHGHTRYLPEDHPQKTGPTFAGFSMPFGFPEPPTVDLPPLRLLFKGPKS